LLAQIAEIETENARLRRAYRVMFAEIFRLEVLLARRCKRVGSPSNAKPASRVRMARRARNHTAGAPDALRWFLQQVKGGQGRQGLLRSLCKKKGGHSRMS